MSYSSIIPVLNGREFVGRAIESVIGQSLPAGEIIVVDDGSTDGTPQYIRKNFQTVRVITHPTNLGLSAARNTAIRCAHFPYLMFLDSDDTWFPDKAKCQMNAFSQAPSVSAIFTDFRTVDQAGASVGWQGGILAQLQNWKILGQFVGNDFYLLTSRLCASLMEKMSFVHPSTVCIKKQAFDTVGLFDETYRTTEDLEMWIRISHSLQFGFLSTNLSTIESREGSLGAKRVAVTRNIIRLYSSLKTDYPDEWIGVQRVVRQILRDRNAYLAELLWDQNDRRSAISALLKSLSFGPSRRNLSDVLGILRGGRSINRKVKEK